jgi:hypothetical protein
VRPSTLALHVNTVQAYCDDALLLDHDDRTFTGGYLGLWTKADSVTEFADLVITGTPAK